MEKQRKEYGIEGLKAPELANDIQWVDGNGADMKPIKLSDFKGKFKVIYGFQSWCPGCHSRGLPALQKMVDALKDNDQVVFFAAQTVFEGFQANTKEKLLETQKKYNLKIPFGHDTGNEKMVPFACEGRGFFKSRWVESEVRFEEAICRVSGEKVWAFECQNIHASQATLLQAGASLFYPALSGPSYHQAYDAVMPHGSRTMKSTDRLIEIMTFRYQTIY